jgi:AcrR family transcriptional regulator
VLRPSRSFCDQIGRSHVYASRVPRPTRQQIDDEIVDIAATLFARHGLQETSVQRIADAVGYSKSGLLRHYPSKEALQDAVVSRCLSEVLEITTGVAGQPPGPQRDAALITALAQLALRRPGFVALLLSWLLHTPADDAVAALQPVGDAIMEAFAVTPDTDLDRVVRVTGALGAVAVARVALLAHLSDAALHEALHELVDVGLNALGHAGSTSHR